MTSLFTPHISHNEVDYTKEKLKDLSAGASNVLQSFVNIATNKINEEKTMKDNNANKRNTLLSCNPS
jgi:hypothetical protein